MSLKNKNIIYYNMDDFPYKTFIAYLIIWGTWLFSHSKLLQHPDYLVKMDDLIYNNCAEPDLQDEFIDKCKLVHGNKYDYSKVEYTYPALMFYNLA